MQKILIVAEGNGKYDNLREMIEKNPEETIISRCSSLSEAAETIRNEGADIVVADISEAFPDIMRADAQPFTPTKGNAKQDLSYIKQYIRNHFREKLDNTMLAAIVHITPNYLCTLFKKEEKMSVREYIEKVRLERAAYLLISEELSINDISAEIGYRQPSYFCRVFRNHFNETPSEYRKNRKREKNSTGERT